MEITTDIQEFFCLSPMLFSLFLLERRTRNGARDDTTLYIVEKREKKRIFDSAFLLNKFGNNLSP